MRDSGKYLCDKSKDSCMKQSDFILFGSDKSFKGNEIF